MGSAVTETVLTTFILLQVTFTWPASGNGFLSQPRYSA